MSQRSTEDDEFKIDIQQLLSESRLPHRAPLGERIRDLWSAPYWAISLFTALLSLLTGFALGMWLR